MRARLERGGLIVRRALLPTPREDTEPCARAGPHGGLRGFPLVALLLVIDLRPASMPDGLSRPLHERLADARWTLEAPRDPGLPAAAFRHWRDAGVLLACSGGRRAGPLGAEGDEQPGGTDRARTWKGLEQGEIGMALGTLGDGVVEGLESVQGDTELADEGLDEQGLGDDDARIAGQRRGRCDGLETLGDDVSSAHVVVAAEGRKERAPCEVRRFAGRPATQNGTKDHGVFLLKPLEHLRKRVFQGPREAMGDPHCVADHTAAGCDALCQGAQRGALRMERLQRVALGQQQCAWACGIGGGILGAAGGKAARYRASVSGLRGKSPRKSSVRTAETMGPLLRARQMAIGLPAHRWRRALPHASMASGVCARLQGSRGAVPAACQHPSGVASAQSRPTNAAHASCVSSFMSDLPACGTVVPRDMRACVLRRHEREPVQRQPLRMR